MITETHRNKSSRIKDTNYMWENVTDSDKGIIFLWEELKMCGMSISVFRHLYDQVTQTGPAVSLWGQASWKNPLLWGKLTEITVTNKNYIYIKMQMKDEKLWKKKKKPVAAEKEEIDEEITDVQRRPQSPGKPTATLLDLTH